MRFKMDYREKFMDKKCTAAEKKNNNGDTNENKNGQFD